jgi:phosphoadenylyl-sulfate reductase (thioredoxin)
MWGLLLTDLSQLRSPATAEEVVRWAVSSFKDRLALVTSFQDEGMVILDMAARVSPNLRVVTLDTGRLPEETYAMMEQIRERHGVTIETAYPDAAEAEQMVTRFGPNLFYESVPMRTLCCQIRKVRPLERKLRDYDAYLVGLRRLQSESRSDVQQIADVKGQAKISPLAEWTSADVQQYIALHDVPRHPLYEKGYTSIGCAPCTRATKANEGERAGRWWWEQGSAKECGLHFSPDGRMERTVDVLLREVLRR